MIRLMILQSLLLSLLASTVVGFAPTNNIQNKAVTTRSSTCLFLATTDAASDQPSRRSFFVQSVAAAATLTVPFSSSCWAAEDISLDSYLYRIVRVKEATAQERRLIQSGKFKDIQRANVKLAVKFMVQNYRLSDSIVGASAYLSGSSQSQQMNAINIGQSAVQNLQTILEYFDTSDVENIKVGANSMAGKETLVLKGLESAGIKLDEFLSLFPAETVAKVKARIKEENELNVKEFDPKLGDIINLPPPS